MENKKVKVLAYAGITLFIVFLARNCSEPHTISTAKAQENGKKIPAAYVLKPEEKAKVIVDTNNRRVTVVTPDKIQTFEGVRQATITEKKDGGFVLTAKQYGWCVEPGLGAMVSDRAGFAVDLQLAYWKSLGVHVGARLLPAPVPFLAVSYSLSGLHLPNTSVYAGVDWRHYPCFGLRIKV